MLRVDRLPVNNGRRRRVAPHRLVSAPPEDAAIPGAGAPRTVGILGAMASVETGRTPRIRRRPARPGEGGGQGDPCQVIVLNDDHNTFQHVAATLARYIPGVTFEGGMALANAIHNRGQARVWSGERERAELYWEQLRDAGLTMAPLA
jgi:ATP-dependent Clp protease adaptor protein ClpS